MRTIILMLTASILSGCHKSFIIEPVYVKEKVDSVFYLGWHDQRTFIGTVPLQDSASRHFFRLLKTRKYYDGFYLIGKDTSIVTTHV